MPDLLQCNECDHVFDRDDSYEYQIINNHVLDDDVADSNAVCTSCGSEDVCDYEPIVITTGDKVRQFAVNLTGGAAIAAVLYAVLIAIFAIDAVVGGGR